jgi:hypothetical protein
MNGSVDEGDVFSDAVLGEDALGEYVAKPYHANFVWLFHLPVFDRGYPLPCRHHAGEPAQLMEALAESACGYDVA